MTKQELAAKIWATANVLRKNIKASEYKDYILGFMFYKYLSDREIEFIEDEGGTKEDLQGMTIMGPLSRPHSKILRVHGGNLFYAAKQLKYNLSGTSYPSAS